MRYLTIGFIGALLAILFIVFFALMAGRDESKGGHGVCNGGVVSITGTDDLVTYAADSSIITGVCVKAGNTYRHTFFTTDVNTGCYDIKGIGTSKITVERLREGRTCQGLSHIDVLSSATPTVTVTPIVSVTTTPTPRSTPTSTSGQAGAMIPTSTPIGSGSTPITEMPSALPSTGGEGSDGGGIGLLHVYAVFLSAWGAGMILGYGLGRRGR